jgi:anaerobic selenocysteine-containing dehydrogenase
MGWHDVAGGGWYPLESGIPKLDPTAGLEGVEPMVLRTDSMTFPYQSNSLCKDAMDTMAIKALIGTGNCLDDFLAPLRKRVNHLDLTVYFGSFPNRTRQAAHMVFPATAWAERDGVCFSDDGGVQWSPRIIKPSDACRTGLGFWMRLAQRFGWEDHFPWKKANGLADQKVFYQWLFKSNPQTGGLQMDRIVQENAPVPWIGGDTDTSRIDGPMLPAPDAISVRPASDDPSAYPLGFHATRSMTRSGDAGRGWLWSRALEEEMGIRIHPDIARTLEIENGETIVAASADESIEGPAVISRMVPPRLVWSQQRMIADHVLVYRKGQAPDDARDRLKAIEL